MAGAGQPFYMPLTWPIGHTLSAISKPQQEEVPKPSATPDLDLIGHLTSCFAATRSFAMAWMCIYLLYPEDNPYPAFGAAKDGYEWSWMWPIIMRDLAGTWLICGLWDWFLYFSPLKEKLHKYKINPVYPSNSQIFHDAMVTTVASLTGAAIEIWLCHQWASGKLAMQADFWESPATNIVWAMTITHWRIPHFWAIHRGMHPWKTETIPDVGKFLYKHVHSLHHKSYNPTAFSGTNMHPVESTLYYSACLIAVYFGCHPAIVLGCIIDCAVGAWLGHDGFQWPGSGDYFHMLHHKHFDCNYGAMHVPIDKWLGTYAPDRAGVKKIWGKKKFGMEANKDAGLDVHPEGLEPTKSK